MRILIIGFIAFFVWSTFSAYIYVCKIRGLCYDTVAMQNYTTKPENVIAEDTLRKPVEMELSIAPSNLIIYFAFDKYEVNSDVEADKYFNESMAYLDRNSQAWLNITGYTDAIGSDEYNQALGYRRAQSLQHYFTTKGMPASKIMIESKGEKEPADDNNTSSGRANNRVAAITIKK